MNNSPELKATPKKNKFVNWLKYTKTESGYLLLAAVIPAVLFFVACGILLGTILSERAAPGVSSAIISAAGLLGGCWMSLDMMGGFEKICRFLPFYPAVRISREAFVLSVADGSDLALSLLTVLLWTALVCILAVLAFRRTMKGDR